MEQTYFVLVSPLDSVLHSYKLDKGEDFFQEIITRLSGTVDEHKNLKAMYQGECKIFSKGTYFRQWKHAKEALLEILKEELKELRSEYEDVRSLLAAYVHAQNKLQKTNRYV